MSPAGTIVGIVLGAGASSRLGRPKQLLDLGGEPLIRHAVRRATQAQLDDVIVVIGANADAVISAIGDLPVTVMINPDYATGQSTSFRTGLREAAESGASAIVMLLGDQPEVGPAEIDRVVGCYRQTGAQIVQALYGDEPSHPILFARALFPELEEVVGDQGARGVIKRHAADVQRVRVSDGPPPADIDTEADYQALRARWTATCAQSNEPAR